MPLTLYKISYVDVLVIENRHWGISVINCVPILNVYNRWRSLFNFCHKAYFFFRTVSQINFLKLFVWNHLHRLICILLVHWSLPCFDPALFIFNRHVNVDYSFWVLVVLLGTVLGAYLRYCRGRKKSSLGYWRIPIRLGSWV